MRLFSIIALLWHTTPCLGNTDMIANVQSGDLLIHACFAKFVKEKYKNGEVIIYDTVKLTKGPLQDIMEYLAKNLMQSGYKVCFRACALEGIHQKVDSTSPQFVIFADDAEELDHTLSHCINDQYSAMSQFVFLTASENEVNDMSIVVIKYHIHRYASTIVTAVANSTAVLKYYKGRKRCHHVSTDDDPLTYNCSLKEVQNVDILHFDPKSLLKNISTCPYTFGVRKAPPFAFLGSNKQLEILGLNTSTPRYLGFEVGILSDYFGGFKSLLNISDVHTLGEYDRETNTRTGLIKELHEGRVDIVLGAIRINEGGVEFDSNYPITQVEIIAVVQKQKNNNIFVVFDTFSYQVWLVILFVQVAFVFVISVCFRRYSTLSIGTAVMYSLAALLGKEIPIRKANLKIIFLSWILFTLFVRSSFEALSVRHLLNKDNYNQVNSLHFICHNAYTIFVPDILQSHFKDGYNISGCYIPPKRFFVADDPLETVANDKTGRAATFTYSLSYINGKMIFLDEEGVNPFHVIKESVGTVPIVYLVRKGDVLLKFLEYRGKLVLETGLPGFYLMLLNFYNSLSTEIVLRQKESNLSLKLKHIKVLFYLYLIGIALASIAFVAEILYFKFTQKPIHLPGSPARDVPSSSTEDA